MIIVRFTGGLGNQMFQYALGRRLALLHGVDLKFDLSSYLHDKLRAFALECFDVVGEIASDEEISRSSKAPIFAMERRILNQLVRWGVYNGPVTVTDEPPGRQAVMLFNQQVLSAPRYTYVNGYWQSEKYFHPIRQVLMDDFKLRDALGPGNRAMAMIIQACNSVSLHVRRGDYVSNPMTNHSHGTLGLDYYKEAVRTIASTVTDPHFFIFSDDNDWAQEHLETGFPETFVTINGGEKCYWDIELMRLCKHHIIANSSFSWWGAWLVPDPQKVVIAPKQWFNNFSADTRDLIPESWVRV